MVYDRVHSREISDYGGLAKTMPLFCFFLLVMILSSIGLPGLNGFVGEFLILLGAFRTQKLLAFFGGLGVILGAVYMLWLYQRVVFGATKSKMKMLKDLSFREVLVLVPLVVMILVMGIFPKFFLDRMDVSSRHLLQTIRHGIHATEVAKK